MLTGFKYIGETIDKSEDGNYVFGMEESYGYLVGKHARDKDAISAIMIIAEMFAYYKKSGKTLISALNGLYEKFGYFTTSLYNKTFDGKDGMEYMRSFTAKLRSKPWEEIAGEKVLSVTDYSLGVDGLPKSDVMTFKGERFSLTVRPSGTEPKLKTYLTAVDKTAAGSETLLSKLKVFAENAIV